MERPLILNSPFFLEPLNAAAMNGAGSTRTASLRAATLLSSAEVPFSPSPGASHLSAPKPLLPRACSPQKTKPFSAQCDSLESVC